MMQVNEALPEGPSLQLDLVRDPARMRRVWASLMPHHRVEDCSVVHARYKLGKNKSWLVCYRLTIRQADRAGSQILYARFYSPGGSLSRFLEARRAPLAAPAFGEPLVHLPDLEAVVWAFPNDRRLPGIPALMDRRRLLTDVVPALVREAGAEAAAGEVSVELVQYIPEHVCTVRVTARLAGGGRLVFYGKTYNSPEGEETYRNMRALWHAPERPAWLGMAQPLAYDPEHLTLWQLSVDGAPLAALERTPNPRFFSLLEDAGRAVAALHSIPVPGLKQETSADVCARLEEVAGRLAGARPALARRVSSLAAQLLADAAGLDTRPAVPLHRDLSADNLFYNGSGIAIIDLDQLRAGDPLEDLGRFLGRACGRGFLQHASAADIAQAAGALLRGYERHAPWEVPRPALRWYAAAALVLEADRAVTYMKACSPEALLEQAEGARRGRGLLEPVL